MNLVAQNGFVCLIPDDPAAAAAGEILPSHWNAPLAVTGTIDGTDLSGGNTGQIVMGVTGLNAKWSQTTWPDTIGNTGGILHQAFGSDNVDVRQSLTFTGSTLQVAADAVAGDMTIKVEHVGSGVGTGRAVLLAEGQDAGGDAISVYKLGTTQTWTAGAHATGSASYKISASGALGTNDVVEVDVTGRLFLTNYFFPSTEGGAFQAALGISGGTGVPNNASGVDGYVYFRSDGGVGTTIYQRRAGAWVGVA